MLIIEVMVVLAMFYLQMQGIRFIGLMFVLLVSSYGLGNATVWKT
jgi:hypothetical protein